jgi:ELWxxDGT repeat protein
LKTCQVSATQSDDLSNKENSMPIRFTNYTRIRNLTTRLLCSSLLLVILFSPGWVSAQTPDASQANTISLVKDIRADGGSYPEDLTAMNGTLFFSATDGIHGYELWKTNGTEAGTMMVKDINPTSNNANVIDLLVVNNSLYFTADDGTHGQELWKTDGTSAGTVMVKDINPDSGSSMGTTSNEMANVNGI